MEQSMNSEHVFVLLLLEVVEEEEHEKKQHLFFVLKKICDKNLWQMFWKKNSLNRA